MLLDKLPSLESKHYNKNELHCSTQLEFWPCSWKVQHNTQVPFYYKLLSANRITSTAIFVLTRGPSSWPLSFTTFMVNLWHWNKSNVFWLKFTRCNKIWEYLIQVLVKNTNCALFYHFPHLKFKSDTFRHLLLAY